MSVCSHLSKPGKNYSQGDIANVYSTIDGGGSGGDVVHGLGSDMHIFGGASEQ